MRQLIASEIVIDCAAILINSRRSTTRIQQRPGICGLCTCALSLTELEKRRPSVSKRLHAAALSKLNKYSARGKYTSTLMSRLLCMYIVDVHVFLASFPGPLRFGYAKIFLRATEKVAGLGTRLHVVWCYKNY